MPSTIFHFLFRKILSNDPPLPFLRGNGNGRKKEKEMVMEKEKRAREKREEREEVGRRQGAGRVTAKQAITRLVGRRMLVKVKADEKRVGESAVLGGEEWGGGGSKDEGAPSPMRRFAQGGVSSLRSSPRIEPCRIHGRARLSPPPHLSSSRESRSPSPISETLRLEIFTISSFLSLSLLLPFFGSQLPERSHSRLDQREREKFFSPCNVKYRFQQRNYGS